jgi:BFD-like [2Fe-2S] binding domain
MIVCSCAAISDTDIEQALVEIMSQPGAPLPTPGVVYRHLDKRMVCCGCSPLAVSTIYQKIDELAEKGVVCPYACACAQGRLLKCASETPALRLIESTPIRRRQSQKPIAPAPSAPLVAAE